MKNVLGFRSCLLCVLVGLLGATASTLAAPWRIGLVGPARDDPHWVAFQVGLRAARAQWQAEADCILLDRSPRRAGSGAGLAAARELLAEGVDVLVVMALEPASAEASWASLGAASSAPPVLWIGPLPAGVAPAASWQVDWSEWARCAQVVSADLAGTPEGGLVACEGFAAGVEPAANALALAHAWPTTGLWQPFDPAREATPRGALRVRLVGERGALLGPAPARPVPLVLAWVDALSLAAFDRVEPIAIVAPHFIEAGGGVMDWILAARAPGATAEAAPVVHRVGPLLVTRANAARWQAFWRRYQY